MDCVGSTKGGQEIVQFTNVGTVQEVTVTGLSLEHGVIYYATVRGRTILLYDSAHINCLPSPGMWALILIQRALC